MTVWTTFGVEVADKAFEKALAQVRGEKIRIELLEAYEQAVNTAAEAATTRAIITIARRLP